MNLCLPNTDQDDIKDVRKFSEPLLLRRCYEAAVDGYGWKRLCLPRFGKERDYGRNYARSFFLAAGVFFELIRVPVRAVYI